MNPFYIIYIKNFNFWIITINLDKFKTLIKITNIIPLYSINNYISEKIIIINENGFLQKWNFQEVKINYMNKVKFKYLILFLLIKIFNFIKIGDDILLFQ